MSQAITGRWSGKRSNGRPCTVTEVTEYPNPTAADAPPLNTYVLVDHEPTTRLAKGQYQILPGNELVTCDDPEAP
jgi:hypothetical protein